MVNGGEARGGFNIFYAVTADGLHALLVNHHLKDLPGQVGAWDVCGLVDEFAEVRILPEVLFDEHQVVEGYLKAQKGIFLQLLVHEHRRVAPTHAFHEADGGEQAAVEHHHLLALRVVVEELVRPLDDFERLHHLTQLLD